MKAEWIAVDWGTTHLRAWIMDEDSKVIDRRSSDKGMGALRPQEFAPTIDTLTNDVSRDHKIPMVVCGMAGSRQGWAEAPYFEIPCAPPGAAAATAFETDRFEVRIIPGLKQMIPADVMRGEETQIAGFLANNPDFEGVICLPGTHTKWVRITGGRVVSFRTFMTGELFALIGGQSVLKHSISPSGWDEAAFESALKNGLDDPGDFAGRLFGLRAMHLLNGQTPEVARAKLSAMLIASELSAAKDYWDRSAVVLIGDDRLNTLYATGLSICGVKCVQQNAEAMTLAGLCSVYVNCKGDKA